MHLHGGVTLRRRWHCLGRGCDSLAVTVDGKTPMHPCRAAAGLMVPLVPEGTTGKLEERAGAYPPGATSTVVPGGGHEASGADPGDHTRRNGSVQLRAAGRPSRAAK